MSKITHERFPRNLYKKGGSLYWGRKENTYSTVLVKDEEEMEEALANGYEDDFSCILKEGPSAAEKEALSNKIDEDF